MTTTGMRPSNASPTPKPALSNRTEILQELTRHLLSAWDSFDHPRPSEPQLSTELLKRLGTPLPEQGEDPAHALGDAVQILESSVSPARPLFVAYVGSSGLETSVLASAISAAYDINLATAAGAADQLDQQAVQWIAEFVGFPLGEGHFTSGGQTSNLTALLAAREHALPDSRRRGVQAGSATVYCSDEAHHSVVRAVEVAGLGSQSLRRIPVNGKRQMQPGALEQVIQQDIAAGRVPVAVVATAGTTLTGAVDSIADIADVCERYKVWLHVDGAYGLPAAATEQAKPLFAGLDRADSATVDAHKWLGMQKSCSAVLLRQKGILRATFGHEERYMLHEEDASNPVDQTLEYSRPFRSLRLWLSMRSHGAAQFRSWIAGTLQQAQTFTELVRQHPQFELLHEPMLSTICFRHIPRAGLPEDQLNTHNTALARAMQQDGRVYLAPAVLDGKICLRVCFVNFRTPQAAVPFILEVAQELGEKIL